MLIAAPLQAVTRLSSDPAYSVEKATSTGSPITLFMNVNSGPLTETPVRCSSQTTAGMFSHKKVRAEQLLDAAGWQLGPDGVRERDGHRLSFEIIHFPDYKTLASAIQGQLAGVGIEVKQRPMDILAAISYVHSGHADAFIFALTAFDPSSLSTAFHSRSLGVSAPWTAIVRDGDIDALLDKAAAEFDPARQCQLYGQFEQKYLSYAAAYAIWELAVPIAVRSNVTGLRFIPSRGFMPSFQELSIQSH